jgi:anhydro-N-acetylmuramic acid kinase
VDFIASHGHTVFHQPEKQFTLQVGCGAEIARITGCVVISDFRTQDVAMGGQGAPLVPIGDALLFSDFSYCLNLGGFANISFEKNGVRKAFDLCPVNSVLNFYANQIGFDFDDKGQLAARGKVATPLLDALNSVPFYRLPPPKSLGFEFVASKILPLMDSFSLSTEDLLCTFVEHVAVQVSKELVSLGDSKAFVTGGGAYHAFLMERIQAHTEVVLVLPSSQLVEFKEALIFGLLGLLKLEDKPNCLQSVTGAFKDHSSGKVEWP